MHELIKITSLFALTAVTEIVGCYLPWLVLKLGKSNWLLLPAAVSLVLFAWLLTLAAGRTNAAYGGMYIVVALAWLYGQAPKFLPSLCLPKSGRSLPDDAKNLNVTANDR